MWGEPNWLASYLAKKITRRAFSVYLSNIPGCSSPAFDILDSISHLGRSVRF
jgi:hypothetical protein